ncbi:hypothetical protein [Flavobacterium branchiophilum]|nr:hypothetical protein [Flavobacterium branchiophilum]
MRININVYEKAFGLDKSDAALEYIPLVYQPVGNVILNRKHH